MGSGGLQTSLKAHATCEIQLLTCYTYGLPVTNDNLYVIVIYHVGVLMYGLDSLYIFYYSYSSQAI